MTVTTEVPRRESSQQGDNSSKARKQLTTGLAVRTVRIGGAARTLSDALRNPNSELTVILTHVWLARTL
jgi:hypothetical protein